MTDTLNTFSIDYTSTIGLPMFSYYLEIVKENSNSIYGENQYGDIYRIEKASGKVFYNGNYDGMLNRLCYEGA